ncbi:hypothetical protein A3H03_02190 [Candidatus Kuenenbacteria bacterium RIFCSPLOWO2_12_FULL_42_13]|uniref:AAA+ ATPase domain-containing protein n=1 Tax=Candidatus Kuenenbacteria bacterium RIFCSPLOWO2_12_FULL_42_13 TaxID=1798565 RepID=A0A1F6G307_9BACT|nr:MAG: hypothetical protein A3H03_02190 [Candidatus Kuenenbacteria bacterium RIFCSPLOWO2_12_FULL_42_13]
MHLKKLTVNGFKSFAHKATLEFSSGITAIVGPNGSGKSNIADAIRWVMGEQSIKTLRGKKSEDIIFSGSDKKARLGLAEVSLELDNADKKIPLDYSEITITRRLYRNGDSDYLINNHKSKLADLNLLLTQANFGHHTYAIVGQGMIDNFLLATPEERKNFFEEATGVKQYQIKKNQTISKLEQVGQNLATAKIRIQEMEPQLQLLTRQVKKLNKRKETEVELNEVRLNYYGSSWQEINKNYQDELKKTEFIETDKKLAEEKWKNLEKELNQIVKNDGLNQTIEKLRGEQQAAAEQKMRLKEKLFLLKNSSSSPGGGPFINFQPLSEDQMNQLNAQLSVLEHLQESALFALDQKNNIETIKTIIDNLGQKIEKIIAFLKPYLKPKKETAPKIEQTNPETQSLEQKIAQTDELSDCLQIEIKNLLKEDEVKRSKLWDTQQKYQLAQQELRSLDNQLSEARIILARTETKKFDLKQESIRELGSLDLLENNNLPALSTEEKNALQNKINKLKGQLEIIGGLDPGIDVEYKNTQKKYDFLTAQISDLNQTLESLKKTINDLDQIIKSQMTHSLESINAYFQKYFGLLFNGGKAVLSLLKKEVPEEDDPSQSSNYPAINFFQEKSKNDYDRLEIYATPPGKKLKSINVLSGGERALTSIALICAIISSNPAPFIVLDEVDAALDESNSVRFAQILNDLSHKTQFIVITHNRATMEKAKLLYGVAMSDDGVSKLLSIRLGDSSTFINTR